MFCDTHCHLFKEYYNDIKQVINDSVKDNVNRFIVAGCDNLSNKEVIELIEKDNCYGCLGIHPEYAKKYKDEDLDFIEQNLNNKKIVAIGEIGLDYYYEKESRKEQIKLFEQQLELAQKYKVPVVIHSREATKDTIDILKKYQVKGVIHSFNGSLETAQTYIRMGFLLGVNGVITFKNCKLLEVYKKLGINHIVLETDSPYLTPTPFRGKQNYPGRVYTIAKFLSDNLNISMPEIEEITNKNIKQVFDI